MIVYAPVPDPVNHRLLNVLEFPANVLELDDASVNLIVDVPADVNVPPVKLRTVPVPLNDIVLLPNEQDPPDMLKEVAEVVPVRAKDPLLIVIVVADIVPPKVKVDPLTVTELEQVNGADIVIDPPEAVNAPEAVNVDPAKVNKPPPETVIELQEADVPTVTDPDPELESNMTSVDDVGAEAPLDPPDADDQFDVEELSQVPPPPTQNLVYGEMEKTKKEGAYPEFLVNAKAWLPVDTIPLESIVLTSTSAFPPSVTLNVVPDPADVDPFV